MSLLKSAAKKCTKCGGDGPFYRHSNGGLRSQCKGCCNRQARAWAANNREKARLAVRRHDRQRRYGRILKKYKLTEPQVADMLMLQGGGCAICLVPLVQDHRHTVIDHCHKTGKVRGVLCRQCNSGIGQLRDDPTIVAKAAEYLASHQAVEICRSGALS